MTRNIYTIYRYHAQTHTIYTHCIYKTHYMFIRVHKYYEGVYLGIMTHCRNIQHKVNRVCFKSEPTLAIASV